METDTYTANNDKLPNEILLVPVIEEHVIITKQVKETGRIQIEKKVSEHNEAVNVSLSHEECIIEHLPRNVYVDTIPVVRQEGNTTIIPVLEEVVVKRTLLVEEIRITKNTVQTNEQQNVTLRKEHITIEHI